MKAFILPLVLLVLTGCSGSSSGSSNCSAKQITCPSFTDNVSLQWAPYTQNQQIIFNSATADKDTFNISSVSLSDGYQQSVSASQPFCSAQANFQTALSGSSQTRFYCSILLRRDQFNNTTNNSASVSIRGTSFTGAGFSDTGLIGSTSSGFFISHFHSAATINGKSFSNIQEVYLDTSRTLLKPSQVYKVWLAKNIGVAGYEEYHGKLWVKQ